ncbi:MAG: hypothetical protein JEZ10_06380 [Verrucomicrobia bacterium]|nr:hypothetical protein [Verrucomicrobiota bacterium]
MSNIFIGLPPESRIRRFFGALKKIHPAAQAAIIAGVFSVFGIWYGSHIKSAKLESKLADIERESAEKQSVIISQKAEIQRLETQLTPFKTIALHRFAGNEKQALDQLERAIQTRLEKVEDELKHFDMGNTSLKWDPTNKVFTVTELDEVEPRK